MSISVSGFYDMLRSLGGAFTHRLRAALTLLGIVIGTGSIVLLASLLHGGETYLVHANQSVSDDDVIEAYKDEPPSEQRDRTMRPLSRADGDAIALRTKAFVDPESSFDTYARYDGRKKRVAIVSSGPSTLMLYRLVIEKGRVLDSADREEGHRVCVIGHEIYEELLRSAPLESLRLDIDGRLFSVVGVLAKKPMLGATDSTYLWDRKVMIPETTYDTLYAPSHEVQRIYVRSPDVRDPASRKIARATVRGILTRRHFGVLNFDLSKDDSGGTEQMILSVIQILLLGTGVLALVASGINIMNVMLVTVSERKREIGLRRAIGATSRSILVQFLLEAATLSFTGAAIGVFAGAVLAVAISLLARAVIGYWEIAIPLWSIGLGVGLAVITGLVFGILPAWRASKVTPIEALRAD